jgi:hypothetical protein
MKRLGNVQRLFWEAITHPVSVQAFLNEADEPTRATFVEVFAGTSEFSASARVEVYARGYFYRLLDVLKEQYPVVAAYLGSDEFHDLVTDYLLAHPSHSPNLHDLGDAFPTFLAGHEAAHKRPYLSDFASIEHALGRAIEAADGKPVTADDLAALSPTRWPELVFSLVPSARLLDTRWNLAPSSAALRAGNELPDPLPGESTLVWRRGYVPLYRSVGPNEALALRLVERSCSFAALGEHFESQGESPADLSQTFARWVNDELLDCRPRT